MKMYFDFNFKEGNPYITLTVAETVRMIKKYDLIQTNDRSFYATPKEKPAKTYAEIKAALRDFAIFWQADFGNFDYDYYTLSIYEGFFETIGKQYGLLTEFKENCIC